MPSRVVVPFVPVIKAGRNEAEQAAEQLTTLIAQNEDQGWRFCHLEDVSTVRNNGCLASFSGNPTSLVTVQVAVFEKD